MTSLSVRVFLINIITALTQLFLPDHQLSCTHYSPVRTEACFYACERSHPFVSTDKSGSSTYAANLNLFCRFVYIAMPFLAFGCLPGHRLEIGTSTVASVP